MAGIGLGTGNSYLVSAGKVKKAPPNVTVWITYNQETNNVSVIWFYRKTDKVALKCTMPFKEFRDIIIAEYKPAHPKSLVRWSGMKTEGNFIKQCILDDDYLMEFN